MDRHPSLHSNDVWWGGIDEVTSCKVSLADQSPTASLPADPMRSPFTTRSLERESDRLSNIDDALCAVPPHDPLHAGPHQGGMF